MRQAQNIHKKLKHFHIFNNQENKTVYKQNKEAEGRESRRQKG